MNIKIYNVIKYHMCIIMLHNYTIIIKHEQKHKTKNININKNINKKHKQKT